MNETLIIQYTELTQLGWTAHSVSCPAQPNQSKQSRHTLCYKYWSGHGLTACSGPDSISTVLVQY